MEAAGRHAESIADFRRRLAEAGADYDLLSALPDSFARVRFIGQFQGAEVLWDMRLYTLPRYWRERGGALAAKAFDPNVRGVIEIRARADGELELDVAVNVTRLTEPEVRKAIIMMRNYKALKLGRHVWGMA